MFRWMLVAACTVVLLGQTQDEPPQPPATQPAAQDVTSQPAQPRATLRDPEQADLLKNLLNQQDRPVPIKAQTNLGPTRTDADGLTRQPLLLEGTYLAERPGRLTKEEGQARFVFHVDGSGPGPRSMPVLESQLLETLEREAEAGFTEFIVSGEVTRYHGRNYLLLRKVLRRTNHGNLGP